MPEWSGTTWLHALGVGGITTLVVWVGYGVMWLAIAALTWWEGGE
jgi:hypothetical protein